MQSPLVFLVFMLYCMIVFYHILGQLLERGYESEVIKTSGIAKESFEGEEANNGDEDGEKQIAYHKSQVPQSGLGGEPMK